VNFQPFIPATAHYLIDFWTRLVAFELLQSAIGANARFFGKNGKARFSSRGFLSR
jgi:hypothetical protein